MKMSRPGRPRFVVNVFVTALLLVCLPVVAQAYPGAPGVGGPNYKQGKWELAGRMTLVGAVTAYATATAIDRYWYAKAYARNGQMALGALTMGGAATGFGAGLLTGSLVDVAPSQAIAVQTHAMVGFWDGLMIGYLTKSSKAPAPGSLIGIGAGLGMSAAMWRLLEMDPGAAQFSQNFSLFAMETAALSALTFGGGDAFGKHKKVTLATTLAVTNAAMIGGYFIGDQLHWTEADQLKILLGGLSGNMAGMTIVSVIAFAELMDSIGSLFEEGSSSSVLTPSLVGGINLGCMLGGLIISTLIVRPWRNAGKERDWAGGARSFNKYGTLFHVDQRGFMAGVPALQLVPSEFEDSSGFGVHLPLLSVDL